MGPGKRCGEGERAVADGRDVLSAAPSERAALPAEGSAGLLGHGREGRRRWRAGPKRGEGRSGPGY